MTTPPLYSGKRKLIISRQVRSPQRSQAPPTAGASARRRPRNWPSATGGTGTKDNISRLFSS